MARAVKSAAPPPVTVFEGNNSPAFTSEVIKDQEAVWDVIEDVLGGTRRLRLKGATYLPQHPGEKPDNYSRRLSRSRLFPAFRETVEGCTGLVFRRPPVLDIADTSTAIRTDAENIDGLGNAFHIFAKRLFWNGLAKGWHGIFVDYPSVGDNPARRSKTDEQGLRPYWARIDGRQVRNFDVETKAGRATTAHLTLQFDVRRRAGLFGEQKVCELREYTLDNDKGVVEWLAWEEVDKKWQKTDRYGTMTRITRIPFTPFYAGRVLEPFWAEPPLEELVYTNLAHYRLDTNYETGLEMALGPILVINGRDAQGQKVVVGPYATIDFEGEGDAKYIEHAGTAFSSARERIQDYKAEEAAQGLSMLQRETRAAETAEAKRIDKGVEHSKLGTAAAGLQDALEQALVDHAEYRGVAPGKVRVNLDFENLSLSPDQIRAYMEMASTDKLSLRTMWAILREGRALPEDFDPEKELALIAEQIEATRPPLPEDRAGGEE